MSRCLRRCLYNFNFFSYIMERIDIVILGAESVVENGGIVNKVHSIVLIV